MWGTGSWGEMIWGGGGVQVPLLGPGGLVLMVLAIVGAAIALRRRRPGWIAACLAVALLPLAPRASTIGVPYVFTNGTIANANDVNANFGTLAQESNTQDARIAALEASEPWTYTSPELDAGTRNQRITPITEYSVEGSDVGIETIDRWCL